MVEFNTVNVFIGLAVNGIFTGLGTAIGSYIATKHVIERISKTTGKELQVLK